MLKCFSVTYKNEVGIYAAESASKARYMSYKIIQEYVDPKVKFGELKTKRLPIYDELAVELGPGSMKDNDINAWHYQDDDERAAAVDYMVNRY